MTDLNDFLKQEELVTTRLCEFKSQIKEVAEKGSYLDKQIVIWYIINYIPLNQFKETEVLVTFYEDWLVDPVKELEKVYEYIDVELPDSINIKDTDKFQKSSRTSEKKNFGIANWKGELSEDEIKSGLETLKIFGLEDLYDME